MPPPAAASTLRRSAEPLAQFVLPIPRKDDVSVRIDKARDDGAPAGVETDGPVMQLQFSLRV